MESARLCDFVTPCSFPQNFVAQVKLKYACNIFALQIPPLPSISSLVVDAPLPFPLRPRPQPGLDASEDGRYILTGHPHAPPSAADVSHTPVVG